MFCLLKVFSLSVFALFSFNALAVEQTTSSTFPKPGMIDQAEKPHVGLLAGLSSGSGDLGSGFEVGVDAGYQPYVPYGLGLEISTASADRSFGPNNVQLTRTKFLAKGSYNFGGTIPVIRESYVGLGVGPLLESIGSSDRIVLGLMPIVGFDIPLQHQTHEYMSAGLSARYLMSSSGNPDAFSLNGMLKYWF